MATADENDAALDPSCQPCRGTGSVISQLGGHSSQVECPWCEGTGKQLPGHDAQAARVAAAASR
jgi:DnaJ-class molecular chaperone